MSEDNDSSQNLDPASVSAGQSYYMPALVLTIIGLVFSILLPIVTYVCSTVGLVLAVKNRNTHKTTAAIVMGIVALPVALINSILGAVMMVSLLG